MPNLPIPRFQIALDQIDFLPIDAQLELLHIYTSYNRKRNHTREQRISGFRLPLEFIDSFSRDEQISLFHGFQSGFKLLAKEIQEIRQEFKDSQFNNVSVDDFWVKLESLKNINWTPKSLNSFRILIDSEKQPQLEKTLRQLAEDPFHPNLKTHKLIGYLSDVWICSLGEYMSEYSRYQILFEFVQGAEPQNILLLHLSNPDSSIRHRQFNDEMQRLQNL
jgi:hypothetical protein